MALLVIAFALGGVDPANSGREIVFQFNVIQSVGTQSVDGSFVASEGLLIECIIDNWQCIVNDIGNCCSLLEKWLGVDIRN